MTHFDPRFRLRRTLQNQGQISNLDSRLQHKSEETIKTYLHIMPFMMTCIHSFLRLNVDCEIEHCGNGGLAVSYSELPASCYLRVKKSLQVD
jgi:hypothetical protein